MESRVSRRDRERLEEARREAARRERIRNRTRELERELEYEEELERRIGNKRKDNNGGKSNKGKIVGVIILILVVLLVFTGLRVWMEMRPGAAEPVVIAGSGEFYKGRVNILFLGSNQGLTDTVIVFSLDYQKKQLDVISIPRDTYYSRPHMGGAAFQKLNSVYSTEGFKAASQAASDILAGMPIHYYAEVDVYGAARIIDAMGGVTMYVPMDMQYVDTNQDLYIDLKAGMQHLNGTQAIHFARYRSGYADADLGRIRAQQELLKAIAAQAGGFDYARIAVVARAETRTNMSVVSQVAFMGRLTGLTNGTYNMYTVPGGPGMMNGLSYYFHDADATRNLVRQIYGL